MQRGRGQCRGASTQQDMFPRLALSLQRPRLDPLSSRRDWASDAISGPVLGSGVGLRSPEPQPQPTSPIVRRWVELIHPGRPRDAVHIAPLASNRCRAARRKQRQGRLASDLRRHRSRGSIGRHQDGPPRRGVGLDRNDERPRMAPRGPTHRWFLCCRAGGQRGGYVHRKPRKKAKMPSRTAHGFVKNKKRT